VRGSANLLTRTTGILAALFFATAIGLTILSELDRGTDSILNNAAQGGTAPTTVLDALQQMQQQSAGDLPLPSSTDITTPAATDSSLPVPPATDAAPAVTETAPAVETAPDATPAAEAPAESAPAADTPAAPAETPAATEQPAAPAN
jgi:preprotein translocase subunit SecG